MTTPVGADMVVVELREFGDPRVLRLGRRAVPTPSRDEALLHVDAVGINPVDLATRPGHGYLSDPEGQHGLVLGWDVAGTVIAPATLGSPRPGQRVFGTIRFPGEGLGYSEYVAAPVSQLAMIPDRLGATDAAALAMPALTAWQVLHLALEVTAGERVLITGGSGAVGQAATQIAARTGAGVVVASSRPAPPAIAAHDEVDWVSPSTLDEPVAPFDAVFDPVKALTEAWVADHVGRGGRVVAFGRTWASPAIREIRCGSWLVDPRSQGMREVADLADQGILTPVSYEAYPLAAAARAHTDLEKGATRKAVLVP